MNRKEIQKKIMALLPSESLRRAMEERNESLSYLNLVKVAWQYVPLLEDRLKILEELSGAPGKRAPELARKVRERMLAMREEFLREDPEAVYELHITEKPDAYEERYLCRSFEAALQMIEGFWQEYEDVSSREECENVVYKIAKRKILSESFAEDEIGMCLLNAKLDVKWMDVWSISEEDFGLTDNDSSAVAFPNFIPDLAPVRYRLPGGFPEYGVNIDLNGEDKTNEFYVLNLDSGVMYDRNWDWITNAHEHIAPHNAELIRESDLPDKLKTNYENFLEVWRNNLLPWKPYTLNSTPSE